MVLRKFGTFISSIYDALIQSPILSPGKLEKRFNTAGSTESVQFCTNAEAGHERTDGELPMNDAQRHRSDSASHRYLGRSTGVSSGQESGRPRRRGIHGPNHYASPRAAEIDTESTGPSTQPFARRFVRTTPWTKLPIKKRLLRHLRHRGSRRSTCVAGANWSICGPTNYTAGIKSYDHVLRCWSRHHLRFKANPADAHEPQGGPAAGRQRAPKVPVHIISIPRTRLHASTRYPDPDRGGFCPRQLLLNCPRYARAQRLVHVVVEVLEVDAERRHRHAGMFSASKKKR
jgi:hypothetical protein